MTEREELKVEEIRTDNTESLKNALERIKELEGENAELKSRLNAINRLAPELEECAKLKKRQLTEAKEIIREYVRLSLQDEKHKDMIANIELFKKAESFLKECGE